MLGDVNLRTARDLVWAWDPIGIADGREEAEREYDEFADGIEAWSKARSDRDAQALVAWVRRMLESNWSVFRPDEEFEALRLAIVAEQAKEAP